MKTSAIPETSAAQHGGVRHGSSLTPNEILARYYGKPVITDGGKTIGTVIGVATEGHGNAYLRGVVTDGAEEPIGTEYGGGSVLAFEEECIRVILRTVRVPAPADGLQPGATASNK